MNHRADWLSLTQPIRLTPDPNSGCTHLGPAHVHDVTPHTPGCQECLQSGDGWVHLRICMECGHVGCCDSSPNRHATQHFHATKHPIVRSVEPGETWASCYVDNVQVAE